ncbi:MAG: hypothetical protein GY756_09760 [bacterium]|nr:hypothetical protein [bacterium]
MNKKYFRLVSDVNINSIETELRKIEPDFLLSFNFNQKILENIFNIPKTAALNIHPSFLPFYRGIDPLLAARARNEDSSGVSVHLITEQIDQGDILAQKQYSIDYKKNIIDEYKELFRIGSELAKDVITDFTYYYSKRKKQNSIEGSYYSWPDANEYKKYRETKI